MLDTDEFGEGIRLHIGCGSRVIPGFVNLDVQEAPHVDIVGDARNLSIIPDACARLVYASHVLEYFDRHEAQSVLREWVRVLRPGGELRLSVPDFDQLLRVYGATGELCNILGPLFGRMPGSRESEWIYHKTVWNWGDLHGELSSVGLESIHRWNWRETEHADFDDHSQAYFPHMRKQDGLLISINISGRKPIGN